MNFPRDLSYLKLKLNTQGDTKSAFSILYSHEEIGLREKLEVELFGRKINRDAALKIVNKLAAFMADDATNYAMWNNIRNRVKESDASKTCG